MYTSLTFVTGGAKDADIYPLECLGPVSDPLYMVSVVGNRVHSFNSFVCLEKRGNG